MLLLKHPIACFGNDFLALRDIKGLSFLAGNRATRIKKYILSSNVLLSRKSSSLEDGNPPRLNGEYRLKGECNVW